jgi:hypothetical protein
MRHEATATCLSWIPPTAVEGTLGLPFALRIAHYDAPPPDARPDVDALLAADASFTQTAGGHTGAPAPRPLRHPPYWRLTAPMAWSTVSLTLHADGTSGVEPAVASPFPRHYRYDAAGHLSHESAVIRFGDRIRQSGLGAGPWGGGGGVVPAIDPSGIVERRLAGGLLTGANFARHPLPPGGLLSTLPISDDQVHLLLDGVMVMGVDGEPIFEVGPGSIYSATLSSAYLKDHVTVRARTPSRLAVLPLDRLGEQALAQLIGEQFARLDRLNP